jgi:hypothetical protein
MTSCKQIRKTVRDLAALPPEQLPPWVREHLTSCPGCLGTLESARLSRGLVAAAAEGPAPPAEFAERVLAALPAAGPVRGRAEADPWRPAWGLVPAFAAMAAALLILFQSSAVPIPGGLLPVEGLSAGERLVMEARPPDPDLVLAAVLEGSGQ